MSKYDKKKQPPTTSEILTLVGPKVRDLTISFLTHISYYALLIVTGIVVNLSPSSLTAVGSFGLGSLGVAANYNRAQNSVDKFLHDRGKLKTSIDKLELFVEQCDSNDLAYLHKCKNLIENYLATLDSVSGSNRT